MLGFLFGGFNRWFDRMTALYGRAVGRTLRLSAMVLVIYAGLLGMTYWQFQRTPTGFIPATGQGLSAAQRAVAGFRLRGAHASA